MPKKWKKKKKTKKERLQRICDVSIQLSFFYKLFLLPNFLSSHFFFLPFILCYFHIFVFMCVQLPTHIGKCMEDITLKGIKRNGGQIHLSRKLIELILGLQKILPSNMMNKGTPCNEIWLIFSVVFDGRIHVQLRAFWATVQNGCKHVKIIRKRGDHDLVAGIS